MASGGNVSILISGTIKNTSSSLYYVSIPITLKYKYNYSSTEAQNNIKLGTANGIYTSNGIIIGSNSSIRRSCGVTSITTFKITSSTSPYKTTITFTVPSDVSDTSKIKVISSAGDAANITISQISGSDLKSISAIITTTDSTLRNRTHAAVLSYTGSEQDNDSSIVIGTSAVAEAQDTIAIGGSAKVIGFDGIAIGSSASVLNTKGVAVGYNSTATNGIAIGYKASNTTSGIAIGSSASANSGIAIGSSATATTGTNIGAGSLSTKYYGASSYSSSDPSAIYNIEYTSGTSPDKSTLQQSLCLGVGGVLWTYKTGRSSAWFQTSDMRDKTDFDDITHALDFVTKLKPITYVHNDRDDYVETDEDGNKTFNEEDYKNATKKGSRRISGFKAQEVYETMKEVYGTDNYAAVVSYGRYGNENGEDRYYLSEEAFVPFLVRAIQEQNETIKKQSELIQQLSNRLKTLEEKNND